MSDLFYDVEQARTHQLVVLRSIATVVVLLWIFCYLWFHSLCCTFLSFYPCFVFHGCLFFSLPSCVIPCVSIFLSLSCYVRLSCVLTSSPFVLIAYVSYIHILIVLASSIVWYSPVSMEIIGEACVVCEFRLGQYWHYYTRSNTNTPTGIIIQYSPLLCLL